AGDLVGADARLIDAASLSVNEAPLTGESEPVEKDARWVGEPAAALADRRNIVHMGTSVAAGRASAVVVATGMSTEIGSIAVLIKSASDDERTPLQRQLEAFGKLLAWSTLGIVALVFLAGWLRHLPALELLLTSISLAVAAVPEGLPAIVTIALAIGVQRMARCRVTGEGYAPRGDVSAESGEIPASVRELATLFVGCNASRLREEKGVWTVVGDPTEGAL